MRHRLQDNPRTKRYFWSLFVTMILWLVVAFVIIMTDPDEVADLLITGSYLVLVIPVSLASWFSLSLLLGNSRVGAVSTLGVVVSLYLRIFRIGAWWILLPWWGLILCVLVFLMTKKKVDNSQAS